MKVSYELAVWQNELCHASRRNGAIYFTVKEARKILKGFENAVAKGEFFFAMKIFE